MDPTLMDEEDALIEQQLKEAQERIARLKAQVAKERKMRIQLKKKKQQSLGAPRGNSASAPSLGIESEEKRTKSTTAFNDEEKQRQVISKALAEAKNPEPRAKKLQRPRTSGGNKSGMGTSASQPALLDRPSTSHAAGAGAAAARGLSRPNSQTRPSTSKTSKRKPKAHGSRPHTAGLSTRLSPVKYRPSKAHMDEARNMPLNRLKELLADEVFQEAIKRKGVIDTQLHPRLPDSFRRQPNRAALLSKEVAQLEFQAYESRRQELLAMALQEFEVVTEQMAEEQRKLQREQDKLANVFEHQMKGEDSRLQNIKSKTRKIQNVQLVENRLLKGRRKKFNSSKDRHEKTHAQHIAKIKRDAEIRAERGRIQQEKIKQVSAMKDHMLAARAKAMNDRFRERDARVEHAMKIKREESERKRTMADAGRDERSKRQAKASEVRKMRMQRLVERLHEKEIHVKQVQMKKKAEQEAKRVKKVLRMRRRIENANRARREAEYRNKVAVKKLQLSWARMDKMKEIDEAIRVQRDLQKKNDLIKRHKWIAETELERSITPGPGEYQDHSTDMVNNTRGARWGKHNPKSEIEWIMYRARQIPGPGEYTPFDPKSAITGGTWGKYTPKSDVEWKMLRASQLPGPGEYKPKEVQPANMQAFGNFDPPSEIEKVIRRASAVPGPADYASKSPPLRRPSMADMKRQFSTKSVAVGFLGKLNESMDNARSKSLHENQEPGSSAGGASSKEGEAVVNAGQEVGGKVETA